MSSEELRFKGVKVIGTAGSWNSEKEQLEKLIDAGMNTCQIDLATCNYKTAQTIIENIRECEKRSRYSELVGVLLNISAVRTRVGKLIGTGSISLQVGEKISFKFEDKIIGDNKLVGLTGYKPPIKPGKLMAEIMGTIYLKILEVERGEFKCVVLNSGTIVERSIFIFEDSRDESLAKEVFENSIEDIRFAIAQNVEFVGIQFIPSIEYLRHVRQILEPHKIHILARVEDRWCLDNYTKILGLCDGIILDRSCINTREEIEVTGMDRKKFLMGACAMAKPTLCVNRLSISTADRPVPSRSELSEIYSSIVEGAHGIILAQGDHRPYFEQSAIKKVKYISNSILGTIDYRIYREEITRLVPRPISIIESIAIAAVSSAYEVNAAMIVCLTETGEVLRLVSKYRPSCPVLGCTPSERTARQMSIVFDIFVYCEDLDTDQLLRSSIRVAIDKGLVNRGQIIVVTSGISDNFLRGPAARMFITRAED